jgi:hypothetical protein
MSRFELSSGQSGHLGFTYASGPPDVKWIRPDNPTHLPTRMSRSDVQDRTERANALIVMGLTLGCTVLSLFDLFLLASGA